MFRASNVTLADLVNQHLSFSSNEPVERLLLQLIDTPWFQRLRNISQTANTKLVYMFSEHSRFGHSIGVAFLARQVVQHLKKRHYGQVAPLEAAISVAALLHDIGHLAPGSHAAFKCWFPEAKDIHEEISAKIILQDPSIRDLLDSFSPNLVQEVLAIMGSEKNISPWAWQLLGGGGWNIDRGNWCYVDSVLAGVDYGKYNIPAIVESLALSKSGDLCFFENRLDAMLHFAVSRHVMYRQVYHHRVLLAADKLQNSVVLRARDMLQQNLSLPFMDEVMEQVLGCQNPRSLELSTIFQMRESWWHYHLMRWSQASDSILADLSQRLLNRRLFKTVRVRSDESLEELRAHTQETLKRLNLAPRYYLHTISSIDMQRNEHLDSPFVLKEDETLVPLIEADPLFTALANSSSREWLVLPSEVKINMGRDR
jgi:HD superfamily phosphohydrolase